MLRFTRRIAIAAIATFALSACGQAGGEDVTPATPTSGPSGTSTAALQDIIVGDPNAPVTMIEYASWTCPHCLDFKNDVLSVVQTDYIDTGKVRFVFREFPTPPANIAVAGFAIARCAGEDEYHPVLDELFERQTGILSMARQGDQVKSALMQIAENHGIVGEDAFDACLQDADVRRAISTAVGRGDASGVNATPTVFVNGKMLEGYDWRYIDGMRLILDEALGATPAETNIDETTPEDAADQ